MTPEAFEKVVVRHSLFLHSSRRQEALDLLEELIMPIFSLQEEDRQGHCLPRFEDEQGANMEKILQALRAAGSLAPGKTHRQVIDDLLKRLEGSIGGNAD